MVSSIMAGYTSSGSSNDAALFCEVERKQTHHTRPQCPCTQSDSARLANTTHSFLEHNYTDSRSARLANTVHSISIILSVPVFTQTHRLQDEVDVAIQQLYHGLPLTSLHCVHTAGVGAEILEGAIGTFANNYMKDRGARVGQPRI